MLAAAGVASAGLLRSGLPDTHDGLFHFYRMLALGDAVAQGCCYPRWLPEFAFGYGQPVFTFYGVAAYYQSLSGMLVGLGGEAALKLSWSAGFVVAGAGAYGLARRRLNGWAAGLAGAAYVLFPYRLANVYVRGALAEHWGLALLPLLLLVGERALTNRSRRAWITPALVWASLVLTHHLSAFMAAPLLAAYLLLRGWRQWRRLAVVAGAVVAGTLLTAFYWIPVISEVRWVGLGSTFSTDAWERFLSPLTQTVAPSLFYRYFPDQVVVHEYPLGLLPLALLLLAGGALILRRPSAPAARSRLLFWGSIAAFCWALQLTASAPVWRALPLLGFLQFPWRLMGPFSLAWALVVGAGLDAALGSRPGAAGVSALVITAVLAATSLWALPSTTVAVSAGDWVQEMWDHDAAIGQVGATWTAEYVPVWVTVDRSALPGDPVDSDRPPTVVLPEGARVSVTAAGPYSMTLDVGTPAPFRLAWHSFYYPGQMVTVDGSPLSVAPYTDLGLASAEIPAEGGVVRRNVRETDGARWARLVTAITAAGLLFGSLRRRRWAAAVVLAAGLLMATFWATGCESGERPVHGAWLPYETDMALVGWQTQAVGSAGEGLDLDLYWLARRTPGENYKVFVHLQSPNGEVRAQSDGDPVGGYTRTSRMVGGEITVDRRRLSIPEGSDPGRYALYVGLYRWPEVRNLPVSAGEQAGRERALLGYVEVRP